MNMLNKVAQFASITLAILVFALPVFALPASAYLLSTADMTIQQRECCRKMAGRCEASSTPISQSCCQHPGSPQTAIASRVQKNDLGLALAILTGAASYVLPAIGGGEAETLESPPKSPPQAINVLRI